MQQPKNSGKRTFDNVYKYQFKEAFSLTYPTAPDTHTHAHTPPATSPNSISKLQNHTLPDTHIHQFPHAAAATLKLLHVSHKFINNY